MVKRMLQAWTPGWWFIYPQRKTSDKTQEKTVYQEQSVDSVKSVHKPSVPWGKGYKVHQAILSVIPN